MWLREGLLGKNRVYPKAYYCWSLIRNTFINLPSVLVNTADKQQHDSTPRALTKQRQSSVILHFMFNNSHENIKQ